MTLSEKDARELTHEIVRRNEEMRRQPLALAKAEAVERGKEPFDLAKLETLADTTREGRIDSEEVRYERVEHVYYVEDPSVLTIQDFATKVEELNKW